MPATAATRNADDRDPERVAELLEAAIAVPMNEPTVMGSIASPVSSGV